MRAVRRICTLLSRRGEVAAVLAINGADVAMAVAASNRTVTCPAFSGPVVSWQAQSNGNLDQYVRTVRDLFDLHIEGDDDQ